MTYELALKLKEAGFPQKREYLHIDSSPIGVPVANPFCSNCKDFHAYTPTLEELIEACRKCDGYDFQLLRNDYKNKWLASRNYGHTGSHFAEGETEIEAVANLYLVLNKK